MKRLMIITCLCLLLVVSADDIAEYVMNQYNLIIEDIFNDMNETINSLMVADKIM